MSNDRRWFVFYTESRAEADAGKAIHNLGFPVFVPLEKRMQRLPNRRPRKIENALFARYGFVQFEPEHEPWSEILDCKGVMDILRCNLKPVAVPQKCIDALQLASSVGIFDRTKPPAIGMDVQVMAGPFLGWIGKILRARTGDRMDVMLKFLGAECRATISLTALREIT